ncbi:MAG: zinc-dependent metalloprotease [Vicinamibacterales bacterium]
MRRLATCFAAGLVSLSLVAPALAQGGRGGGQGGGGQAGPLPSIETRTTGFEKLDGFYPLYWNARSGDLLMEIPALNQEVLYQSGLAAGLGSNDIGLDRAQLGSTKVVRFERVGTKILMVQPNYDYRADSDNPDERKDVEDAFAKSVVWGFTAIAETDGRVLVDLGDFVLRDAHGVSGRLGAGYRFERSRSAIYKDNTKAFPENTEIEVTTTLTSEGGGGRGGGGGGGRGGGAQIGGRVGDVTPSADSVTVRQHHSFIKLPDATYHPRAYDPRAGFGGGGYENYGAALGEDMTHRWINRHRLEKKDPNAAVSEAVEPIVYYVDRGTPEPIRSALVEGASWWNQAFEAAGFRNAFQVRVMPEGADPMDVRYNTITWVHRSTRGWSYGSSITDPRTGEILKGHVSLGSLRVRQDYMIFEGLLSPYTNGTEKPGVLSETALARIRQLAAHEVGHTIGLGHNYYNSTKGRISVMDYPHPLITLRSDGTMDLSRAYEVGIGPWDKVAIQYGYSVFPSGTDENAALKKILDDGWAQDYRYLTNQDLNVNPNVDQWNNGIDTAEELNRIMALRRAALTRFGDTSIKTGQPWATLEEVLVPVYLHHRYAVESAATALGGQEYIYGMRGDGRDPVRWAPAARQNSALEALMLTLQPSELAIKPELLSKLPPRPPGYGRTREMFPRLTGGAFDPIAPAAVAADMTIGFILTNDRAARLVAQKAVDPTLPGLEDVIDRIDRAVFQAQTSSPYEEEIARAMQRAFVSHLMSVAESAPTQARAIATAKLKAIETRAEAAPAGAAAPGSFAWQAHRALMASDIKRFVERPYDNMRPATLPDPPPGAPIGDVGLDYLLGLDACGWTGR